MSREISSAPAQTIVEITQSDTVNIANRPRGIYVTSGTVSFVNADGTATSLADGVLAAGVCHPLSPIRINNTGTTATVYGVY